MSSIKSFMVVALTLAVVGTTAHAESYTLSAKLVTIYPVPGLTTNGIAVNSSNYMVPENKVGVPQDYVFEIDAQAVTNIGTSYGDSSFDVSMSTSYDAVATRPATAAYNYRPNKPFFTDDGDDAGAGDGSETVQPVFSTNADAGISYSDLVGLADVISNGTDTDGTFGLDANDPRRTLGITAPFKLGTVKVTFDGEGTLTFGFTNVAFADLNDSTLQYGSTLISGYKIIPATVTGIIEVEDYIPEPASLGLLALGGVALIVRRRLA